MNSAIHVVSSMATRALLAELVDVWHAGGGIPVTIESVSGVDAARRVASGEPFDVVVLASDAIDRLADSGHVIRDSKTDLLRSETAIAVRRGAPHPAIGDEHALRAAVLAAGRIAFSSGPSGAALGPLFERWGLTATLQDRLVQAPPGVPVGSLIAKGEAELGFQQLSELLYLPGIDVVGTMPPSLEIITTFSAARCSASRISLAAQKPLLDFLRSSSNDDVKRRHGMLPMPGTSGTSNTTSSIDKETS